MKILFIGDVVGKIGRKALERELSTLKTFEQIDFTIINGENISHGKGIIRKHYDFLLSIGADAITLGNHYNSKSEVQRFIDSCDRLIRPANLIEDFPGEGSKVFLCKGKKIRVTNILCKAFMQEEVNDPYTSLKDIVDGSSEEIHIVDLHGEATGEKQGLGYAFDGKVTAILGTHTHVQTNDERILSLGTGFMCDVGMVGDLNGVLGFEKNSVINKTIFGQTAPFTLSDSGSYVLNAVVLDVNINGKCNGIKKIRIVGHV